jgi:peptidoglycan/LPS O-acetylase OafA/YrhL
MTEPAANRSRASVAASPAPASARTVLLAAVADVALVLVFVAIGRRSHDEDSALIGFATTAWPFLAGVAVGWAAALVWRRPLVVWPSGVVVWVSAVVLGMLLRLASGQGVQLSFVIVTAVVLGVFLVGWRGVVALVRRRRRRRG